MALRLRGASSGYIELKAPASAGDNTLTLPTNDGTAHTFLKTDGSGNLSWQSNLTFDGTQLVVQGGSGTQHLFKHSAGWGGITSAGSAGGSGAGFSLANNYSGTLETKWSIYLDGATDALRFTANTPDQTGDERLRITSGGNVNQTISADAIGFNQTASANHYIKNIVNSNRTGADAILLGLHGQWNSKDVAAIKFRTGSDTTNKDDGYITFETSSANNITERVRIENDGNVTIQDGDLVIGTSGHGIDFSATEGGTGTSNEASLLADYETGTWIPSTGGGNWTATTAIYVKVGGLVNLFFDITNTTGANRTSIENLPFSVNASHSEWHIGYYAVGGSTTSVDAERHGGYTSTSGALITTVGGGTSNWTISVNDRLIGRATYYTIS